MYGAIIGDVIGSVYEWNNVKTTDFPLFGTIGVTIMNLIRFGCSTANRTCMY